MAAERAFVFALDAVGEALEASRPAPAAARGRSSS
jgi:hypothetical protein